MGRFWCTQVCKDWGDPTRVSTPCRRKDLFHHGCTPSLRDIFLLLLFTCWKDMEKAGPFSQMLLAWVLPGNTNRSNCWLKLVSGCSSAWGNEIFQKNLETKPRKKYNFMLFCDYPELQTWNMKSWVWNCIWTIGYWRVMLPHAFISSFVTQLWKWHAKKRNLLKASCRAIWTENT